MHTTNTTTEFILGFVRFYILCSGTLIMEEYETLSCACGYHEYQRVWMERSGWQQWGKNFSVKGKGHKIQWIPSYAVVVKKDGITVGKAHSKF